MRCQRYDRSPAPWSTQKPGRSRRPGSRQTHETPGMIVDCLRRCACAGACTTLTWHQGIRLPAPAAAGGGDRINRKQQQAAAPAITSQALAAASCRVQTLLKPAAWRCSRRRTFSGPIAAHRRRMTREPPLCSSTSPDSPRNLSLCVIVCVRVHVSQPYTLTQPPE